MFDDSVCRRGLVLKRKRRRCAWGRKFSSETVLGEGCCMERYQRASTPSMCAGSTPRSRVTRMPFSRRMRLAGDMRQNFDPKLPGHLPILNADL
jgi:hypothetical protein